MGEGRFSGNVAIVTGSGVGAAAACGLAAEDATVIIAGRTAEKLRAAVAAVIAFLASADARLNGAQIWVDSGLGASSGNPNVAA